jgi:nucleoside-diphosphate-sugar epimerase
MRPFFVVIFNGASSYGYAKTHSEKLVWECVNNPAGCPFDAVSVNPGVVLGEVLCKMHTKSSAVLLRQAIYNNPVLNYPASYVDVKDVARMHLRCLQVTCEMIELDSGFNVRSLQVPEAGGHRFIATSDHDTMNTVDLCGIAQRLLPQYDRPPNIHTATRYCFDGANRYSLHSEPMYPPMKWALLKAAHMATLGSMVLNEFQIRSMEHPIKFSNAKSKRILGMEYRILGDTVVETVTSMIDKEFIPPILRKTKAQEAEGGFLASFFEVCSKK